MKKLVVLKLALISFSLYIVTFVFYYSWCIFYSCEFMAILLSSHLTMVTLLSICISLYWIWAGSYYRKHIKKPWLAFILGNSLGYLSLTYTYIRFYVQGSSMRPKLVSLPFFSADFLRDSQPITEHIKDWCATGYCEWLTTSFGVNPSTNFISIIIFTFLISTIFMLGYFLFNRKKEKLNDDIID